MQSGERVRKREGRKEEQEGGGGQREEKQVRCQLL